MNTLILELTDDQLELMHDVMSYHNDVNGGEFQSPEMEELGEIIRSAIEELE
jgi:hypothetical protein